MKNILIILILGLILLNGCINDRRMLELAESEASLEKAKARAESTETTGRPEQAGKLVEKLYEQCKQEIGLYFEAIKSIDYAYELSNQMDKDGDILSGLCSDLADEILDKGQYTDVDLIVLHKELSKELSTKAKEVRDKLATLYPDKLETQPEESRYEIADRLLDDLLEYHRDKLDGFRNTITGIMDELEINCQNKKGSSLELCIKCYDELITQGQRDDRRLSDLWSASSDEILDKGQYTDENLQDLYDESIRKLDVKAQEITQNFIDLYEELGCKGI